VTNAGENVLVLQKIQHTDNAALRLQLSLTSATPGSDFLRHMWNVTAQHAAAPNAVTVGTEVMLPIDTSHIALSAETAATPQLQYADQLKLSLSRRHRLIPGVEGNRQLHTAPQAPGYSILVQQLEANRLAGVNRRTWCINLQLGNGDNGYSFSSVRMPYRAYGHTTWRDHQYEFGHIDIDVARQLQQVAG
jgi:hypothetical protein